MIDFLKHWLISCGNTKCGNGDAHLLWDCPAIPYYTLFLWL
jgi:hypothetical protein